MDESDLDDLVSRILRIPDGGRRVRFVAVDGHGGAGKSTLAGLLAPRLAAQVVHADDLVSDVAAHPHGWWRRFLAEVVEPIEAGATTLTYERGSWGPEHDPPPVTDQPVTGTMLVEGVASARRELRPHLSFAIWVDTPRDLCIRRGLERDGDDMAEQWEHWRAREEAYVAEHRPQAYADVVVPGAGGSPWRLEEDPTGS